MSRRPREQRSTSSARSKNGRCGSRSCAARAASNRPSRSVSGSEVAIRSNLPGDEEELFEVDRFIPGHQLSLVGAYSCRRRIDIRIEQKSERSKLVVRVDYPTYGGVLGALVDRLTRRRKLDIALNDSLIHFKGLCEFDPSPERRCRFGAADASSTR